MLTFEEYQLNEDLTRDFSVVLLKGAISISGLPIQKEFIQLLDYTIRNDDFANSIKGGLVFIPAIISYLIHKVTSLNKYIKLVFKIPVKSDEYDDNFAVILNSVQSNPTILNMLSKVDTINTVDKTVIHKVEDEIKKIMTDKHFDFAKTYIKRHLKK